MTLRLIFIICVMFIFGCSEPEKPPETTNEAPVINTSIYEEKDEKVAEAPEIKDYTGYARYNLVTKYDEYFRKYSKRYFSVGWDWYYFKAQAIAESGLRPDVKSYVGAEGIMQIMPATYAEIRVKDPYIAGNADNPRWNIAAGISYDKSIWDAWLPKKTFEDKIKFMMGSYNAGRGTIIKAQKLCTGLYDPDSWFCITKTLPQVTKRDHIETLTYVDRIFEIKVVLQ